MKELVNSLTDTLKERVKSPFLGNFAIAYIIANWKIILIIFSNEKVSDKIDLITTQEHFLYYPLIAAILIFLFKDFLFWGTDFIVSHPKRKRKERHYSELAKVTASQKDYVSAKNKLEREKFENKNLTELADELEMLKKVEVALKEDKYIVDNQNKELETNINLKDREIKGLKEQNQTLTESIKKLKDNLTQQQQLNEELENYKEFNLKMHKGVRIIDKLLENLARAADKIAQKTNEEEELKIRSEVLEVGHEIERTLNKIYTGDSNLENERFNTHKFAAFERYITKENERLK